MSDEAEKMFSDLADKLKRESYAAGWHACLSAIGKAVAEIGGPSAPEITELADKPVGKGTAESGVTVGSTPHYVLQAIKKLPGMTGAQIVVAVQEGGHRVRENAIRTSIVRLGKRKLVVKRHGKWFPE